MYFKITRQLLLNLLFCLNTLLNIKLLFPLLGNLIENFLQSCLLVDTFVVFDNFRILKLSEFWLRSESLSIKFYKRIGHFYVIFIIWSRQSFKNTWKWSANLLLFILNRFETFSLSVQLLGHVYEIILSF